MRKFTLIFLSITVAGLVIRAADWPSQSGNPQRDGWAKNEKGFTRANAKGIELLYKVKVENEPRGLSDLTAPIIDGQLITYLGFKEMLVFGGSQDNVWSIDADLNRRIWKTHFDYKADKPAAAPTALCPGGLNTSLAMPGSSTAPARGNAPPAGRGNVPGRGPATAVPAVLPLGPPPKGYAALFAAGFGRSSVFLAIGSDGYLHPLNTSTGTDKLPAVRFLPPNAKAVGLNIAESTVFAASTDGCGGNPNVLYALDMSGEDAKLTTFETHGAGPAGYGATAITAMGTIYTQIPEGSGDVAGTYNDTVLALSKNLRVKDYFTPSEASPALPKEVAAPGITPVTFQWKGHDVVVAGARNGRLYLLDGQSLGGADHHTPLAESEPIASPDLKYAGNGFNGTFSSWEDLETNTRWICASLWGPPRSGGGAEHGSIVAFRLEERDGKPVFTRAWMSRDLIAPAPPVATNGLVFVLSTGESNREARDNGKPYTVAEREKMASHATLYALDAATGAEIYSSGNMASTFAHNGGLAVANKRIYFTTHDNTVFALGFLADQPQLTGR
jgi:outer membrane protein assembly factor BamB